MAVKQDKGAVFNFRGEWITDFIYTWDENFSLQENRIYGEWISFRNEDNDVVYQRNPQILSAPPGF